MHLLVNDGGIMMNERRKCLLGIMLLTLCISGIMTALGIFLNHIPILIFSSLLIVSLPFPVYRLVKNNVQK